MNNQFETSLDLSVPDANEEYYVSPEAKSKSSGITLLMKTVLLYKSHSHLFHSIIQSSSIEDINKTNSKGWTALMIAVRNYNTVSDIECVTLLLEHGADINIKASDGWTVLMLACRYCNADSTLKCSYASTCAITSKKRKAEETTGHDKKHKTGETFIYEPPSGVVKILIEHGADINAKDNEGLTALMIACGDCNTDSSIECVKLLIEYGANINAREKDGFTALMIACPDSNAESSMECVKLLIEHNADINAKNNDGHTALTLACMHFNTSSSMECVKLLMEHGADINIVNNDGYTSLMLAYKYCNTESIIECVKLLLEHGADSNVKKNDGWTVLMLVFRYYNADSSPKCLNLLLEHHVDLNVKNNDGLTALMIACRNADLECVKLLFLKGAHFNFEYKNIVQYLNILFNKRINFIDDMLQNHQYIPGRIVDKLKQCFQLYYYKTSYIVTTERIQNITCFKQCMQEGISCTDIITAQHL